MAMISPASGIGCCVDSSAMMAAGTQIGGIWGANADDTCVGQVAAQCLPQRLKVFSARTNAVKEQN